MRWYMPLNSEMAIDKSAGGEIGGTLQAGQNIDRPDVLKVPPMFGGGTIPLKKGGIAFGLVGHQFYHVGPGEYVDLPDTVPDRSIRGMAPQLMTKEQGIRAGFVNDDGTLVAKPKQGADKPQQTAPAR